MGGSKGQRGLCSNSLCTSAVGSVQRKDGGGGAASGGLWESPKKTRACVRKILLSKTPKEPANHHHGSKKFFQKSGKQSLPKMGGVGGGITVEDEMLKTKGPLTGKTGNGYQGGPQVLRGGERHRKVGLSAALKLKRRSKGIETGKVPTSPD